MTHPEDDWLDDHHQTPDYESLNNELLNVNLLQQNIATRIKQALADKQNYPALAKAFGLYRFHLDTLAVIPNKYDDDAYSIVIGNMPSKKSNEAFSYECDTVVFDDGRVVSYHRVAESVISDISNLPTNAIAYMQEHVGFDPELFRIEHPMYNEEDRKKMPHRNNSRYRLFKNESKILKDFEKRDARQDARTLHDELAKTAALQNVLFTVLYQNTSNPHRVEADFMEFDYRGHFKHLVQQHCEIPENIAFFPDTVNDQNIIIQHTVQHKDDDFLETRDEHTDDFYPGAVELFQERLYIISESCDKAWMRFYDGKAEGSPDIERDCVIVKFYVENPKYRL